MRVLIVEGNTPDLVAAGRDAAAAFRRCLDVVAPQVELRCVAPYAAALSEDDFADIDGVIFTGSGVAWNTAAVEAAPQRAAMETVFKTGLPVWGSCNGMQLAAVVLGGAVGASPVGFEVGLARDIQVTDAGATHAMLAGRQNGFAVPCVHRDEVQRLPEGAVLLAGNDHSPVQAMAYEQNGVTFWGAQYHPELSPADVAGFVIGDGLWQSQRAQAEDLRLAETNAESAARVGTTVAALQPERRAGELVNWIAMVGASARA